MAFVIFAAVFKFPRIRLSPRDPAHFL